MQPQIGGGASVAFWTMKPGPGTRRAQPTGGWGCGGGPHRVAAPSVSPISFHTAQEPQRPLSALCPEPQRAPSSPVIRHLLPAPTAGHCLLFAQQLQTSPSLAHAASSCTVRWPDRDLSHETWTPSKSVLPYTLSLNPSVPCRVSWWLVVALLLQLISVIYCVIST